MTVVFINPGTGPVGGALLKNAIKNMRQWVKDAHEAYPHKYRFERAASRDNGDGRYGFIVTHTRPSRRRGAKPGEVVECRHTVDMPGLPLERVRYLGKPQDIWEFPRLYVDDSSWVWLFSYPHPDDAETEAMSAQAGGAGDE